MADQKVSTITAEQLKESGWELTNDPIFPAKKCLSDKEDEDYDPEQGVIDLVVSRLNNCDMFALSLPDGGLVYINPASIEELNQFEKMIMSYDPPY